MVLFPTHWTVRGGKDGLDENVQHVCSFDRNETNLIVLLEANVLSNLTEAAARDVEAVLTNKTTAVVGDAAVGKNRQ